MVGALPKRPPPFRPQRLLTGREGEPVGTSPLRGSQSAARGILDEERGTPFRPDGLDAPPDASREDE
jgi:hypothetical protein